MYRRNFQLLSFWNWKHIDENVDAGIEAFFRKWEKIT